MLSSSKTKPQNPAKQQNKIGINQQHLTKSASSRQPLRNSPSLIAPSPGAKIFIWNISLGLKSIGVLCSVPQISSELWLVLVALVIVSIPLMSRIPNIASALPAAPSCKELTMQCNALGLRTQTFPALSYQQFINIAHILIESHNLFLHRATSPNANQPRLTERSHQPPGSYHSSLNNKS